ncbi:unnamed protein product [Lathyrus oleraceus]
MYLRKVLELKSRHSPSHSSFQKNSKLYQTLSKQFPSTKCKIKQSSSKDLQSTSRISETLSNTEAKSKFDHDQLKIINHEQKITGLP